MDEQALQDAMAELMFDAPATLTISEGNVSSDYSNGVVRLMKGKLDGDEEPLKSFLHFSTPDVPSLYVTEINRDSQTLVSFLLLVCGELSVLDHTRILVEGSATLKLQKIIIQSNLR